MTAKIAKSRLFECLESDKIKRAVSEQEEVKNGVPDLKTLSVGF